jgi:hypothetical protein
VRIIAAFAAGGGVDITARLMGNGFLSGSANPSLPKFGPGAGGNIGTEAVAGIIRVHCPQCGKRHTVRETQFQLHARRRAGRV